MEHISSMQELLQDIYAAILAKKRKHRISDSEMARWLGVKQATLSHWIQGDRTPDLASAISLSGKLVENFGAEGRVFSDRLFTILGYPRVTAILDDDIKFIAENWPYISDEARRQIYEHVREELKSERSGK